MNFLNLIFGQLLKLREIFQKKGQNLFNRMRDPQTGKVRNISPQNLKRLAYAFGIAFFLIVLISQLLTRQGRIAGNIDDYQKEIRSDGGTRARDFSGRALFDKDPLGTPSKLESMSDVPPVENKISAETTNMFGREAPGNSPEALAVPAASDCFSLIEKVKSATTLTFSENSKLEACLKGNVVPVSESEKNVLLSAASPNLSKAEREAVLSTLSGNGNQEQRQLTDIVAASINPDTQKNLADGINDKLKDRGVEIAPNETRDLSKTLADNQKDYNEAINGTSKILGGQKPDENESTNMIAAIKEVKGGESAALDNPALSSDKEKAIQDLIADVQGRQEKIDDLNSKVAEAQAEARGAAERLIKGEALTEQEQGALDKLSGLRKQLEKESTSQNKRQKTLIELTSRLQKTVAQAALTMQKTIPSGVFEGYADYEPLDCKNIKPLPIKVSKHRKEAAPEYVIDSKGKRVARINMKTKPAYDVYNIRENKDPALMDGKRLDISKYSPDKINVQELFIAKGDSSKTVFLSPETKIAAYLDSDIMVSSTGNGQMLRVKIIQDVFDSKTRQLVIPKNSVVVGRTNGFDENTGVMDVTFDKVSTGSGNVVAVNLRAGSGDMSMGIHGQIRDFRGRLLLGAFISAFSSGALSYFSQNTIAQYQQSAQAITAIQGAALNGGASVLEKISTNLVNQLNASATVFYCPRGIPIVLFPE